MRDLSAPGVVGVFASGLAFAPASVFAAGGAASLPPAAGCAAFDFGLHGGVFRLFGRGECPAVVVASAAGDAWWVGVVVHALTVGTA